MYSLGEARKLTAGLETEDERYSSTYESGSAFGPYADTVNDLHSRTTAGYGMGSWDIGGRWFWTIGARYDHHQRFGNVVTQRITSAYLLDGIGLKLKGSLGTGFKAPTLNQLLHPKYGNPKLHPEKSSGWEIGFEESLFKSVVTAGLAYFDNQFTDLIVFQVDSLRNVNRAVARGWEGTLEYRAKVVSLAASYCYTHAFDKSDRSRLIRRPAHKADLTATCRPVKPLLVRMQVGYVGEREDIDFTAYPEARVILNGYVLTNISATYDVTSNIHVSGRIENLSNQTYQEVYGYGTAKRAAYAGLSVTL